MLLQVLCLPLGTGMWLKQFQLAIWTYFEVIDPVKTGDSVINPCQWHPITL